MLDDIYIYCANCRNVVLRYKYVRTYNVIFICICLAFGTKNSIGKVCYLFAFFFNVHDEENDNSEYAQTGLVYSSHNNVGGS